MPRTARIVIPGYPFHITQRGNFGQDIFEDDHDRTKYLNWMNEYSGKYGVSHIGFCLMSNHVHFISIPDRENSFSKVFSIVHMRYSQYFNRKRKTSGHLWQGRFYSCPLGQKHLLMALKYIERNPVRANLVGKPWMWKWSSAKDHTGMGKSMLVLKGVKDYIDLGSELWKDFIDSNDNESDLNKIRKCTLKGFPLGGKDFLKQIVSKTGREIAENPRGRPRKHKRGKK